MVTLVDVKVMLHLFNGYVVKNVIIRLFGFLILRIRVKDLVISGGGFSGHAKNEKSWKIKVCIAKYSVIDS
jgi:hypothetical protein